MPSPAAHIVPWEIIDSIVDSCWEDYDTLRQLALTCQGLLHRSRIILFHHVRIRRRSSLLQFINTISTKNELAALVVKLSIVPEHSDMLLPPFTSFSRVFRKLRAMSLGVDPTLSTPPHAALFLRYSSVLSLEIANVAFRDHRDLVKLLWTFPKVRTLELGAITFRNEPTQLEIAHLRDQSIGKDRILSALEKVEIRVWDCSARGEK